MVKSVVEVYCRSIPSSQIGLWNARLRRVPVFKGAAAGKGLLSMVLTAAAMSQ